MAYVKFIKGTAAQYAAQSSVYASDGSIFFATDDNLIYANGRTYGFSNDDKTALLAGVKDVTLNAADNTIKIEYTDSTKAATYVTIAPVTETNNGLMTPTQKAALEQVISDEATLEEELVRAKVKSDDGSIDIVYGTGTTGTDLSVNVDGTTIIKDANTGELSVASAALTQYVGDGKTVAVGNVNASNQKEISFTGTIAEITTGLAATVAKAYELQDSNGDPINSSARIVIPKDNSFVTGQMGHVDDTINASTGVITAGTGNAAIDLVYINNSGQYVLVQVDVEQYLKESEFKDGLNVNNHEVSVKLSTNTESAKYLKIQAINGENGAIELSGIDAAITAASSSIAAKTTGHVQVTSTSSSNGTVYTISENDIASAQDLTGEISNRKAVTGVNADTYSANSNTNYLKEATSLKDADEKLDAAIKSTNDNINGLYLVTLTNVVVNEQYASVNNRTAAVTVDGSNIKLDKTNANANQPLNTNGTIKKGDTLSAAIQALEAQLIWYEV